jgi:hypothetical protein
MSRDRQILDQERLAHLGALRRSGCPQVSKGAAGLPSQEAPLMLRYRGIFNSAPIAQFHLRYHWKFPRAGDSAKVRAITPCSDGATMAHTRAVVPQLPLCATSALPSATLGSAPLSPEVGYRVGKGCRDLVACGDALIATIRKSAGSSSLKKLGTHIGSNLRRPDCKPLTRLCNRSARHRFASSAPAKRMNRCDANDFILPAIRPGGVRRVGGGSAAAV